MPRSILVIAAAFCAAPLSTSIAQPAFSCSPYDAVYAARPDEAGESVRLTVVGPPTTGEVVLEGVRGGETVWSARGRHACSNGASICYVALPVQEGGRDVDEVEVMVQLVDADEDGFPEIFVTPGLAQSVYNASKGDLETGGLRLETPQALGRPVYPPNVYFAQTCPEAG